MLDFGLGFILNIVWICKRLAVCVREILKSK